MLCDDQTPPLRDAPQGARTVSEAGRVPPRWLALSGSLALVGIVALAAAARFWALDFGLPYTQARPDETFIIDVALALLSGEFWPPFYDYPRLYAYAVSLLYLGYYGWGALAGRFSTVAEMVASWPVSLGAVLPAESRPVSGSRHPDRRRRPRHR